MDRAEGRQQERLGQRGGSGAALTNAELHLIKVDFVNGAVGLNFKSEIDGASSQERPVERW